MAGRPRRTAMIAELTRRTLSYFEDESHNAFDYVLAWTHEGYTMTALAADITKGLNGGNMLGPMQITRNMLMTYMRELVGVERVDNELRGARREGAHGLVESGIQTLDSGSNERDAANANKLRLEARERLAATWNRAEFARNAGVQVNVSFASQHLNALRKRNVTAQIAATAEGAEPVEQEDEE